MGLLAAGGGLEQKPQHSHTTQPPFKHFPPQPPVVLILKTEMIVILVISTPDPFDPRSKSATGGWKWEGDVLGEKLGNGRRWFYTPAQYPTNKFRPFTRFHPASKPFSRSRTTIPPCILSSDFTRSHTFGEKHFAMSFNDPENQD